MNRTNKFSHTLGLDPLVQLKNHGEKSKERTERDLVVEMIFAPDVRTGLPCSDISVYLSAKTPPQVRDFIQQNLMGEGLPTPPKFEGVSDEDLHFLTMKANETRDEYAQRVNAYMLGQRKSVSDAAVRESRKRLMSGK